MPLEILTSWTESKRKTVFVITFQSKIFYVTAQNIINYQTISSMIETTANFISAKNLKVLAPI